MNRVLLFLTGILLNKSALGAEGGMPQLNPESFSSQLFWLFIFFTIDEVNKLWSSRRWKGKKSGNPLIVRGGYNCRHQWSYVNPDWYDEAGELII